MEIAGGRVEEGGGVEAGGGGGGMGAGRSCVITTARLGFRACAESSVDDV